MHRFFAGRRDGDTLTFTGEDAHHAVRVLRLKAGDEITCYHEGMAFACTLTSVSENACTARILSMLPSTEPGLQITLFQGLPKADKMDLIVQKCVELGVVRIVPVMMSRCVAQPGKSLDGKLERWTRIAREACKQSGRSRLVTLESPLPLSALRDEFSAMDAVLVPWEEAHALGPRAFAQQAPDTRSLGIVIGPEGGISQEEIDLLRDMGCIPLTLGPRILRTETAGLAAVSALLALYGDMEGGTP